MAFPRNSILISNVTRHGHNDPRLRKFGGENQYQAYLGSLEAAKALATNANPLYQDAWLSLNVAVECFFKHIYFLILPQFETVEPAVKNRHPLGPIDYDHGFIYYHRAYQKKKYLDEYDFGHEVLEFWTLLDKFTDANANTHFQNLKTYIPTGSDWVNGRYTRRNHGTKSAEYRNYLHEFEGALNTIFQGLK